MCTEVGVTPPVVFIVTRYVWFIGGLARQIALQSLGFPLELAGSFLYCDHFRVLGFHFVGIL